MLKGEAGVGDHFKVKMLLTTWWRRQRAAGHVVQQEGPCWRQTRRLECIDEFLGGNRENTYFLWRLKRFKLKYSSV